MEFKEFESFVEDIQSGCVVRVRIADNMLDSEDWPVVELIIEDDLVVSQRQVQQGAYQMPNMVGWNTSQLKGWSRWDGTGHSVENYHEISIGPNIPTRSIPFDSIKHVCKYNDNGICALKPYPICKSVNCRLHDHNFVSKVCGLCTHFARGYNTCRDRANKRVERNRTACPMFTEEQ